MATKWLSVEYIAEDLGVTVDTVRAWIRRKELKAYKFGREYKVRPEDYDAFVRSRATTYDDEENDDEK
jgi:excisionase family DNA binding protein